MIKIKQKFNGSPGQALVEFALIITVLLMMIFLIIESARILWAWNTVQNAAREGARYAITGNFEAPNCAVDFGAPKFLQPGGRDVCDNLRLASIIEEAHTKMSGLPLNETSVIFEDDNYYNIEVWGVDEFGQFQYDFGGIPGQPVVVRVTYRVPIITPFFTPILPSIPVFGQETSNNETFGRLSGESQGAGLPPGLPPVPTAGVTPSPTPSPTATDTPTPGSSPTPSQTPTFTPTPRCDLRFEGPALANTNFVFVTGDIGVTVTIVNLSTGQTLGTGTLGGPFDGHACQGFASITLNPGLTNANIGNVLLAEDNADPTNTDTTIVVGQPPTNTPSPTNTPVPTNTPTNTPTPSPSPTPSGPYITLLPNCGYGPDIQFNIIGVNWPVDESLTLFWDGTPQITLQANQHQANFTYTWTFDNVADGTHTVRAEAGGGDFDVKQYLVPCADSPTLTPTPAITATPAPEDLVILGPPKIISTPPLVAYQPMQFSVAITNVGDIDVNSQFFVDIYLDPSTILTDSIPLSESSGYSAVSSLAGGASRVITITSPLGFQNAPQNHQVYGMVDSVQQINEALETNNVSPPLTVNNVTPAATPTPSPTPDGNSEISGIVQVLTSELLPQYRAPVLLIDESTSNVINIRQTDQNGYYQFTNAPSGTTYTVSSCMSIDGRQYYGVRTGITPPYNFANIYLLPGPCP